MQYNQTLCLSDRLPGLVDYTGEDKDFFNWLLKYELKNASNVIHKSWEMVRSFYIPALQLREGISEIYKIIPDKKQTRVEKRIIKILNELDCWEMRAIRLGQSDIANAWTDGSTHITIGKDFLKSLSLLFEGHASRLLAVLCHELAHDVDTAGTHVHGSQFYERFHEIVMQEKGYGRNTIMAHVGEIPRKMKNAVRKERQDEIIRKQKKEEDTINKKLGIAVLSST